MVMFADELGRPSAVDLIKAGFDGVILYAGTPAAASGKDFTTAQYQDYLAHGLQILYVYELGTNDIIGGAELGQAHALDLIADLQAKGASPGYPACAAVDEHVSAANLGLAVEYQRGFFLALKKAGYFGPVGVYGFPEVTTAVHAASPGPIAEWYWGCGSHSAQPSFINIYQSNAGTVTVDSIPVDEDEVLIPVATSDTLRTESSDVMAQLLVPAGIDEHVTVIVAGAKNIYFGTSYSDTPLEILQLDWWGATPSDPAPAAGGIGGEELNWVIDDNRPGPVPIPAGAVSCSIRYTADHAWTVGVV
jgi:glycoside hydrolase-like protein